MFLASSLEDKQAWLREEQRWLREECQTKVVDTLLIAWGLIGFAAVIATVWALIYVVPEFFRLAG